VNWDALNKMSPLVYILFQKSGLNAFQVAVLYWLVLTPAKATLAITGFSFHARGTQF